MGFGVWGLGFWVWGFGFGVWGLGLQGLGFRVSGFRVSAVATPTRQWNAEPQRQECRVHASTPQLPPNTKP